MATTDVQPEPSTRGDPVLGCVVIGAMPFQPPLPALFAVILVSIALMSAARWALLRLFGRPAMSAARSRRAAAGGRADGAYPAEPVAVAPREPVPPDRAPPDRMPPDRVPPKTAPRLPTPGNAEL